MRILSATLLISFVTVFASSASAATQQPKPRLANAQDLINAGYRRGLADAEAAALENTAAGSSSVTTPLSYRKSVYVQAPTTQPQVQNVNAPAAVPAPRQLPSYVQRMQPKAQPTVPGMTPRRQHAKFTPQQLRHASHGHHTQAQMIDCELTDSLNNNAGPVTTVVSTHRSFRPSAVARQQRAAPTRKQHVPVRQQRTAVRHSPVPVRKPSPLKRIANVKHEGHYHHTHDEKADCALVDSLNRGGPVVRIVRKH